MKYLMENSVFAITKDDSDAEYMRNYLREAVEHLTRTGIKRHLIIDNLTAEILTLHKANPFRDPVDEAALTADLESIRRVQTRIDQLAAWLEQGLARGERAKEDADRDVEFP